MPSASRRARSSSISWYSLVGRNSCSGGSSSRIVTGSPSIARKMPDEVVALERQQLVDAPPAAPRRRAAMIISRTIGMRSAAKNMCSVRHEPDALGAELAGLARVLRACRRWRARRVVAVARRPSQELLERVAAARGSTSRARASRITSPVAPSSEITSPSRTIAPPASNDRRSSSTTTSPAPDDAAACPCRRATTAACEVRPPREVRMPSRGVHAGHVLGRGLRRARG